MLNIYLDQKDYIRIAWGLLGEDDYEEDVTTYQYLLSQIESGFVKVFYTSVHLEESTDYYPVGSRQFDKYVEVLQSLTNGNCIISFTDLLKREIHIFLSNKFGFDSIYSNSAYPYGIKSETVFTDIRLDHSLVGKRNRQERNRMKKELNNLSTEVMSNKFPGNTNLQRAAGPPGRLLSCVCGDDSDRQRGADNLAGCT